MDNCVPSFDKVDPNHIQHISKSKHVLETVWNTSDKHPEVETTEELLYLANVPEQQFVASLQLTQSRTTDILKWNSTDVYTTGCNIDILYHWGANIDLQYAVDENSIIMYICGYMMKSEKSWVISLAKLQKMQEGRCLYTDEEIAHELICEHVVGGPEAAIQLLSMSLIKKSRKVIFVNYCFKDQWVSLPKSKNVLDILDPEC